MLTPRRLVLVVLLAAIAPSCGGASKPAPAKPLPAPSAGTFSDGNDADGDGFAADFDRCPDEPEDFDDFVDEDGCPEPDNDKDGIPDQDDQCPNDPGNRSSKQDGGGCPGEGGEEKAP